MGVDHKTARIYKDRFCSDFGLDKFVDQNVNSEYYLDLSISKLGYAELVDGYILKEGESSEDCCLNVFLTEEHFAELNLPDEYAPEGYDEKMRVFKATIKFVVQKSLFSLL